VSAHTPGPWRIEWAQRWSDEADDMVDDLTKAEHIKSGGDGSRYTGDSVCGTCDGCNIIMADDAHLIAAAPDLLHALKSLLLFCVPCECGKPECNSSMASKLLGDARAAIAKAEGKS
jgi:hypothetical protein